MLKAKWTIYIIFFFKLGDEVDQCMGHHEPIHFNLVCEGFSICSNEYGHENVEVKKKLMTSRLSTLKSIIFCLAFSPVN